MLIRLLPDQAANHWDDIKVAVEESLPPTVGTQTDRMSNILSGILTEQVTVWISTENNTNKIRGIVLTTILFDGISGTRSLLMYCVYSYGGTDAEVWKEGIETLGKYAKASKCHRIVGYTDVPHLVEYASMFGADVRYTFVTFDLLKGGIGENIH